MRVVKTELVHLLTKPVCDFHLHAKGAWCELGWLYVDVHPSVPERRPGTLTLSIEKTMCTVILSILF